LLPGAVQHATVTCFNSAMNLGSVPSRSEIGLRPSLHTRRIRPLAQHRASRRGPLGRQRDERLIDRCTVRSDAMFFRLASSMTNIEGGEAPAIQGATTENTGSI
jgi:hypothetical protein